MTASRLSLNGSDWTLTGWYSKQWRLKSSMELDTGVPPVLPKIPAVVPGAVQGDLLRQGWIRDPNVGLQSREAEWVNQRDWVFEKRFRVPPAWLRHRAELCLDGLDWSGEIYLNGELLRSFEGMFKPVVIDVSHLLRLGAGGENVLQVVFYTTPYVDGQIGHSHTIRRLKSRFNYAWDWCPRIVPVGIWRDVSLRTFGGVKIMDFYPEASVDGNEGRLHLQHLLAVSTPARYRLTYSIADAEGQPIRELVREVVLKAGQHSLDSDWDVGPVALWWPNGYGEHPLYRVSIRIASEDGDVSDEDTKMVAFRTIRFEQNPESPADSLPYTIYVNNRRIFLRGANWVPMSPLYGTVRSEEYPPLIRRFAEMNATLLRVWGGAIFEHDAFYATCDRLGLLVWQEFLQSSSGLTNSPPDAPDFLADLQEVSRLGVLALRSHPSLIIWCGGNELAWEDRIPVDERHLNIRMLGSLVRSLDPGRLFLPSSPSGPRFDLNLDQIGQGLHHDIHGPWAYLDTRHYPFFNADDSLFRSETGTSGASRLELLTQYLGDGKLWPPTDKNPYWLHRGAWWIQWDELSRLFGSWSEEVDEIATFVQASRYLQMESVRYAAEATRRREPRVSGFVVWMGNEPFPNASNTSLLEFDGVPKPVYYALKKAFSRLHVAAAYDKVAYQPGEPFSVDIYVYDEGLGARPDAVHVRLIDARGAVLTAISYPLPESIADAVQLAGHLDVPVPAAPHDVFLLRIDAVNGDGRTLAANEYLFMIAAKHPFEPLRRLPKATVSLSATNGEISVTNTSGILAAGVLLGHPVDQDPVYFDHNYFMLSPGQTTVITTSGGKPDPERITVEGINIARG